MEEEQAGDHIQDGEAAVEQPRQCCHLQEQQMQDKF